MGQTAAGTLISNQASLSHLDSSGNPVTVLSNQVDITTVATRTFATLTLNRVTGSGSGVPVGPTMCTQGGGAMVPLPNPVLLGGVAINPNQPQVLTPTGVYHAGEPVFVTVNDQDQNLDPAVRDTLTVRIDADSGDSETLQLSETDSNSGLFAGYVQTANGTALSGDCVLQVDSESTLTGSYQDPDDATDNAQQQALIDPLNLVFDASSGNPINGATVRLVDATTGNPATVYGANGTASFPAAIISGGSITDSSGQIYNFSPGGYRFPVVPAGNYRIEIDLPTGYTDISNFPDSTLQNLPGAPFALGSGSRGDNFVVDQTASFNFDVPLDPAATPLYLQLTTSTTVTSPGDFVPFDIVVENTSAITQTSVTVTNALPIGFRLVPGSVYINGILIADPLIATDGRTLTFALGDLPAGARSNIRYVTEVTVAAQSETATATAQAISMTGAVSNTATLTLQLVEELFRSKAIVIGRAILGSCDATVANDFEGVAGVRIYMDDGRYAITDAGGRFHFEGLNPGTRVVQLDVDSIPDHLELVDCQNNSRFAGRNFSQFVDLRAGGLWRADFHLREKPAPSGAVAVELSGERYSDAEILYTVTLLGNGLPLNGLITNVILPAGVSYVPGTSVIGGKHSEGPESPVNVVTYRLGDKPAVWNETITLRGRLSADVANELTAKAVASFTMPDGNNGRTPVTENIFEYRPAITETIAATFAPRFANNRAKLSRADKRELSRIIENWDGGDEYSLSVIGHTDSNPIQPGAFRYKDNYELSNARAKAVADYIADKLDLSRAQVHVSGRGPDEPIADNATEEGRATNRRVEFRLERSVLITPAELGEYGRSTGLASAATTGARTLSVADDFEVDIAIAEAPVFSEPGYIETLQPGTGWLAPAADYSPAIPSMKIAIQHKPGDIIELAVNGKAVDPLNYVGVATNRQETVAISRWRGVDLNDGNNQLTATIYNAERTEFEKIATDIHYGGGPVRAVFDKSASRLIADGTTKPIIAVQLFDRASMPARPSTTGAFSVDPPYRTQWEVDSLTDNQLVAVGDREPIYRVGENGIAYLQLEPTTVSGEANVRLKFANGREQEIRVWLEPAPRDWILVGFAEGTVGYNTLNDNKTNAAAAGEEEDVYTDGQVSFFAKGQIKGEYLLTMAYRSEVDDSERDNELFGTIDPNRYYTLYGDTTEQRFEAASSRGLFLKIEREAFYVLFGDFDTGLAVTELSRYQRSLTGFKSELRGEHFAYNAFASDTDKAFIRDELTGDGTSGPYRLSATQLVINSDKIEIQIRDRFRSEVILETQPLARFLDYSIDYLTGTIFMKRPIPSRDENFNPVYIVANYETRSSTGQNISAGGRGSWNSGDNRVEIGASVIHQGTEGNAGDLGGADLRVAITDQTEFKAEVASSNTDLAGGNFGALLSLDHQGEKLETRAWAQELQTGFGLGQQNQSETGMRKFGLDGRYKLTEQVSVTGAAFRQDNLLDDAQQDVVEAEIQYQDETRNAAFGLTAAQDKYGDGADFQSNQVFLSAGIDLFGNLLTLRGSAETALGGSNASTNYPDRVLIGADLHITETATTFAEIESARGDGWDSLMTRVGVRTQPWQSAQFNSTVNHRMTEFGPRTFATVGLTQGWQMNDQWYFDFGLDQSRTVGDTPRQVNPDARPASGNFITEDFVATYAGAMYRSDFWTFTSRGEFRDSDSEERINLLGGFYREKTAGHGFSANAQWLESRFDLGGSSTLGDVRLGWSWRPTDSEWVIFDRFDVIYENFSAGAGGSDLTAWKLVNNMNANWMINLDTQLEFQYGAKYARTNVANGSYTSYTDIVGAGFRRDLNDRWDYGMHGDVLHSWNSDVLTYGWGIDVGVTVLKNVWISVGYNFAGFHDADFSGANYTAQGPFITFRMKADQESFHGLIDREQHDE